MKEKDKQFSHTAVVANALKVTCGNSNCRNVFAVLLEDTDDHCFVECPVCGFEATVNLAE